MFACIYVPNLDERSKRGLIDCGFNFSPVVEQTASDAVTLDISGLDQLFGPPFDIARKIAASVSAAGPHAQIAIAHNPDAAFHMARAREGISLIPAGCEGEHLSGLPIELIYPKLVKVDERLALEIMETLKTWGIRRFGEFSALPETGIAERWGADGVRLQQLARGTTDRVLLPLRPAAGYSRAIELEHPIELQEPLLFILASLVNQLCANLKAHALAASELRLVLKLADKTEDARTLRLAYAMRDHKLFLKLLDLDLSNHPPAAPIFAVSLAAEPARPRVVQKGLFARAAPEPEKLELQLARIAKIVGVENVGAARLLDTYRPEGFRLEHFVIPHNAETPQCRQIPERPDGLTAFRFFRPPLQARVQLVDGRPARIAGLRAAIKVTAGPWKISGDWWNPQRWTREEWDVEMGDGRVYRLYRDFMRKGWFIEGAYD